LLPRALIYLFFPGMILHELAHYIACKIVGVKVTKIKLVGFHEAFVQHAATGAWKMVAITIAPFVLNNLMAWILLTEAKEHFAPNLLWALVLLWLGVSFLFYAFPSKADAGNALRAITKTFMGKIFSKRNLAASLVYLVLFPFVFIPVALVLGVMLLFEWAVALRFVWIFLVLLASFLA
jgi:hypothetical protein